MLCICVYMYLSYDPYGPANNFLGKPQEKRSRVRAVRIEVIGLGNRVRPARLTTYGPGKDNAKQFLLLESVSLKMCESEHSNSEFYFLGELSDAEMLQ